MDLHSSFWTDIKKLQAFPASFAQVDHDPFFSVEDPVKWAKLEPVQLYMNMIRDATPDLNSAEDFYRRATPRELRAFENM